MRFELAHDDGFRRIVRRGAVEARPTAPPAASPVAQMRFAFASCQNLPAGYFNPYADVAAQDLDLVVHLGG